MSLLLLGLSVAVIVRAMRNQNLGSAPVAGFAFGMLVPGGYPVNLLEKYMRANVVHRFAEALGRWGFTTESRRLKVQSQAVMTLINKALNEMPTFESWDVTSTVLRGEMSPTFREKRKQQGKYYERIGNAENIMLRTLRQALDSFHKTNEKWNRRQQIKATSVTMKAFEQAPREKARALMAAPKPGSKS
jgi:hypothetical protein